MYCLKHTLPVTHKLLLYKIRSIIYTRWKSQRLHIELSYVNTLGGGNVVSIAAEATRQKHHILASHRHARKFLVANMAELVIQIIDRKMCMFLGSTRPTVLNLVSELGDCCNSVKSIVFFPESSFKDVHHDIFFSHEWQLKAIYTEQNRT